MPTLVIFPEANDGYVESAASTQAGSYDGTGTLTADNTGPFTRQGIERPVAGNGNQWITRQTFLEFDTSVIPAAADVADVRFRFESLSSPTQIQTVDSYLYDFGGTVDASDFQSTAALQAKHAAGLRVETGTISQTGTSEHRSDWYLRDQVRAEDSVRMVIADRHQRAATTPAANDHLQLRSSENSGSHSHMIVYYSTPGARTNHYVESLGNTVSTTAETVKATLTFTPEADSRYMFLWSASVQQSSAVDPSPPVVGLRDESAVWWCEPTPVVGSTVDRYPVAGMAVRTFGASPGPVTMNLVVAGHASLTTTISDAAIIAIKLVDDDIVATREASHAYTGTTLGTGASTTVTQNLPSAGRWMVFGYAESAHSLAAVSTDQLVVSVDQRTTRGRRLPNVFESFMAAVSNDLSDPTSDMVLRKAASTTGTVTHRNARLVGIRGSAIPRFESASRPSSPVSSATLAGIAIDGPAARTFVEPGDYLAFINGHIYRDGTAGGEIELSRRAGPEAAMTRTALGSTSMTPVATGSNAMVPYALLRRETLDAAAVVPVDVRGRSLTAGQTVRILDHRYSLLQLSSSRLKPQVRPGGNVGVGAFAFTGTRQMSRPAETTEGDLLVMVALVPTGNVFAPPAQGDDAQPWRLHPSFPMAVGTTYSLYVWTKRASAEPVSQLWSGTNTVALSTHVAYFAVAYADGIDQVSFDAGDTTSPSATPTFEDELLLWVVANSSANGAGVPQTMANVISIASTAALGTAWEALHTGVGVPTGIRTPLGNPAGTKIAGAITFYSLPAEPPRTGEGDPFEVGFDTVGDGRKNTSGDGGDIEVGFDIVGDGEKNTSGEGDDLEVEFDFAGAGVRRSSGAGETFAVEFDFGSAGKRVASATTIIAVGFGSGVGGEKIAIAPPTAIEHAVGFRMRGFGGIPPVLPIFARMPLAAIARTIALTATARTQTLEAQSRTAVLDAGEFVTTTIVDR